MSENQRNQESVKTGNCDRPSNDDLNAGDKDQEADESEGLPECAVCLLPCVHPVRLPCSHMFCYLCMKGVAGHSRRCALCRAEIPQDFVRRPVLVSPPHKASCPNSQESDADAEMKYHWYYEGVGGWWEYDERTSTELEARLLERQSEGGEESATFDILIAGFIYVIDLENNLQYRRGYPRRRRKIKRDLANLPDCKGVAGLKRIKKQTPCERRGGDGGECSGAAASSGTAAVNGLASGSIDQSVVLSHPRRSSNPRDDTFANASRELRDAHSRDVASADRVDRVDDISRQMTNLFVRDGIRQRHRPAQVQNDRGFNGAPADNRQSRNEADRE